MAVLTTEPNYLRKSHRVTLPMVVIVGETAYRARDWSLSGVGLEGFDQDLRPGEILLATLRLPMQGSRLELQQALRFTGRHGEVAGFEYHELQPRNRRILRHYVELAVEGKLDNVEDLIGVVTAPEIETPIQEALNLADLDSEELVSRFRVRSAFTLGMALLFLLLLAATLFYNTTYRVSGIGVVSGNLRKVSAAVNGVVTQVYRRAGERIGAGDPLVSVRDEQHDQQIALLEQRQLELKQKLMVSDRASATATELVGELEQQAERRRKELARARKLHRQGVISYKDLAYVENLYQQARIALARERRASENRLTSSRAEAELLRRSLAELDERLEALRRAGAVRTVRAPADGVLFTVGAEPGQRVAAGTTVALLQDDRAPFVLLSLSTEDALKLAPGMRAQLVVPHLDREYEGTITALGYSAVNPELTLSQEASLNETLVKIEFDDPEVRLPAHLRVNVWIRTFNWDWARLLPWS